MGINDNGVWKFHMQKEDPKEKIATAYYNIGLMYLDGKGKGDNVKATQCYRKAIVSDPTNEYAKTNLKEVTQSN
jgi:hypothetical protein